MTTYRLDRAIAMVVIGLLFLVAAVAVLAAFLLTPWAWILVVVTAVSAAVLWLRPPVVLRVDEQGFRSRIRTTAGKFRGSWSEVTDVTVAENVVTMRCDPGDRGLSLPLVVVQDGRRAELVRELYTRLNAAHGYRRFGVD